jgi:hypothetical protein
MNDFKAPGKASKLLERSSSSTKYFSFFQYWDWDPELSGKDAKFLR